MWSPWSQLVNADDFSLALVRHDVRDDGYHVQVTDGARLWQESAQREGIEKRARDIHCSIDPFESASQLAILLNHVQEALESARLSVDPAANGSPASQLRLDVRSELPKPLAPLRWPMTLCSQDDASFQRAVFLPLLKSHVHQQSYYVQLIRVIEEKDNAAGKILDKIESKDLDLATFLPPPAARSLGKNGSKKATLIKHIKGLQPFDQKKWWAEANITPGSSTEASGDAGDAFILDVHTSVDALKVAMSKLKDNAVNSHIINGADTSVVGLRGSSLQDHERQESRSERKVKREGSETSSNNEFSRQSTPPDLKRRSPHKTGAMRNAMPNQKAAIEPADDEDTTDDDTLGSMIQSRNESPAATPQKKLGMIGGRGSPSAHPESPSPATTPKKKLGSIGGATPPHPRPSVGNIGISSPSTTPKRKLGTIGGAYKSPLRQAEESATVEPAQPLPKRKMLGVIGGAKAAPARPTSPVEAKAASPTPANVKAEDAEILVPETQLQDAHESNIAPKYSANSQSPRREQETSVERAAHKREELKRQLETQAKTNANRKRRRF